MLASQAPIVSISELHAASEAFEGASLGLLRLVDQTCDSLKVGTKLFRGLSGVLDNLAARINALPARPDHYIDPTDSGIDSFSDAIHKLEHGRRDVVKRKAAINREPA